MIKITKTQKEFNFYFYKQTQIYFNNTHYGGRDYQKIFYPLFVQYKTGEIKNYGKSFNIL